ncbi:VOC family protein [Draconibacterium orientale]|uniref:VOC family protein n=1 Tax=Draconibacterium orientale TaxID=1168034 RepID=UPI002A0A34C9|nr:VOC family protein [Draconibacterium orientale]
MKIRALELTTNNLKQTEGFYTDVLGLKMNEVSSHSLSYTIGSSVLHFTEKAGEAGVYHFAFNIPCNKINEALNWIASKVDPITNEAGEYITNFKNWNAHSVYFFDNNKNILEFIARGDLENSSAEPFTSNSILSINEVGIVAQKPLKLARQLINSHGLEYFEKGPKREDFTVLGDDNGLVVISGTDRNWYPSRELAKQRSLKMKIQVNTTLREIYV